MTRAPIYHLRCNICHTAYVAVVWDLRCVCFACDQVDWRIVCVWLRGFTPWIDVPLYAGERLLPLQAPAGFLESLRHSVARAKEDFIPGTSFAAPGLSRIRTLHHTPQCQWDAGLCDGACREEVTYARVAVTYSGVNAEAFRSPAGSRPRKDGARTSRPGYYMPVGRHRPHYRKCIWLIVTYARKKRLLVLRTNVLSLQALKDLASRTKAVTAN